MSSVRCVRARVALGVVPEILIVGDELRRGTLEPRVSAMGYQATSCPAAGLSTWLNGAATPAAIIVCATGTDAAVLMAELRRTRKGAAIPVTLCGQLGGAIRDLADVLDLGADHFLEEPVAQTALSAALHALAGPPAAVPEPEAVAVGSTQVFGQRPAAARYAPTDGAAEPAGSVRAAVPHQDPVVGRLHDTLNQLEQRLRAREDVRPDDSADDMELSLFGVDSLPETHAPDELIDPAELPEEPATAVPVPTGRPASGPRELTILLDGVGATPGPEPEDPGASPARWREHGTGRILDDIEGERPRRATILPVDNQGRLERIEVPRLLWKLHRAHFDGCLALTRERAEKRVWFDRGNIVFAQSNVGHDRLVDGLLRRGLLGRAQYDAAKDMVDLGEGRAGQLLVKGGFLKGEELPSALREHLSGIVDSTFPWNEGTWQLGPDERCDEPLLLDTTVTVMLLQGILRRMDERQLWALLGGPRQHPRLRSDVEAHGKAELAQELLMPSAQESLLVMLDGRNDLGALAARPDTQPLELLALVYALHVFGWVDLVGEPPARAQDTVDPAQVDRGRVAERLRLCRVADYFEVLSLARDAAGPDIRRAHTELSKTFADASLHRDVREELRAELTELRTALGEAAEILADEDLRHAYLAHLETQ